MGRTRRNCPVFGCGSTNLARLANHLEQVHGMETEQRAKWLKWSKLGMCVPRKDRNNNTEASSIEETLENLLKRQTEMEENFYMYLKTGKSQYASKQRKGKESDRTQRRIKWLWL